MLTLFFLVVGEGSVLSVQIDEGESVDALKKAIKKEQNYSFPASKLTLYTTLRKGRTRNN